MQLKIIARIYNDFPTKFGLPRQSGRVDEIVGRIVFEKAFRNPDAIRGIEEYSHLWLLWEFSENIREGWSATVRPPRLGGNKRMGVFATRSPFRPNPIGLSSVRLIGVDNDPKDGHVLRVAGADMMDATPIYDIKPYIPHSDCRFDAIGGFSDAVSAHSLRVDFPEMLLSQIPDSKRAALIGALEEDPRPSYQNDPQRIYGFEYAGFDVRFKVAEGVLLVCDVVKL